MPGGPIRFQRPARILEPAAGTLSSGLPRVSQTQEKGRREMSSGPPGPKSIGIQTAQPLPAYSRPAEAVESKEQHHARNGRSVARATQRPVTRKLAGLSLDSALAPCRR